MDGTTRTVREESVKTNKSSEYSRKYVEKITTWLLGRDQPPNGVAQAKQKTNPSKYAR